MSHRKPKTTTDESLIGETHNGMNLDMAFEKIGGFGLFQFVATVLIAIWRNAGMWCYNLFPYLVLP